MRAVHLPRAPRVRQCLDPVSVSVEALVTDAPRSGAIVTVDVAVDTGSTSLGAYAHRPTRTIIGWRLSRSGIATLSSSARQGDIAAAACRQGAVDARNRIGNNRGTREAIV
jgi:hypothetical protein